MTSNFWSDLERAYADEDNARFDNEVAARKSRRELRWLVAKTTAGILLSALVTFYTAGVIIFSRMPLPPKPIVYELHDRADLTSLIKATVKK